VSATNLFEQQRANRRRSAILVTIFLLFFAWIGFGGDIIFNLYTRDAPPGSYHHVIPWLGIAAEAPLLQPDEQNQEISIDADTHFDPLSGFLLLRYPNGRLQPFVGIGPTLFVSDLRNDTVDSLRHIFMGIYYSF